MKPTLIVFAEEPVPGRVKLGLSPPCSAEQAAWVAAAALADTLAAVEASEAAGRRLVAFAGDPRGWVPARIEVTTQAPGDLRRRLAVAFSEVEGPALAIGTRTPQLAPAALDAALATLLEPGVDAVLGPTESGGVWAVGLRRTAAEPLPSRAEDEVVGAAGIRAWLEGQRLEVATLPELRAIVTFEDAEAVAGECPERNFVAALGALPFGSATSHG